MKRCFSRYRLALFAISLMSSAVLADQVWKGTCGGDVIDENLVIKGEVLLALGSTKIEAIHKDVTVTLTKKSRIRGHWAGESQLYLAVAEGRKIRFEIDHDLTFVGSSEITGDDLLIVQNGPGTVEVAIAEGKKFEITAEGCTGGVQMYVLMYGGANAPRDEYCEDEYSKNCCDEYSAGGLFCDEYGDEYACPGTGCNENSLFRPTLSFVNLFDSSDSSDPDRRIVIGKKSRLGFLSSRKTEVAEDSGYIHFDPVMAGLGRMILEVEDTGAFTIAGIYTCKRAGCCITTCNIQPAVAAGYQAIWSITNSGLLTNRAPGDVASGLLVLNKNETLSDLLIDPFLNLYVRQDTRNYYGMFSGKRYGVVLGANGIADVQEDAYVDYVGLALNQIPQLTCRSPQSIPVTKWIKVRNPSAFTVDGNFNPAAVNAQIRFGERSAFFVRSGVGEDGSIRDIEDVDPFTVDPSNRSCGFGNIVFDVEGQLHVRGLRDLDGEVTSKIELLSLEVAPTGGSIFVGSGETNFPLRTFNTEDDALLMYNCGAFLINNIMTIQDSALSHTDECHTICHNNDLRSEPTYIGGETWKLMSSDVRPSIRFVNAVLNVNASIALTGMDLVVPNFVDELGILRANLSEFIFYSDGACVDNGTGRDMILGTRIGSTAADGCTTIDANAYLDVMELYNAISSDLNPLDPNGNQTLDLLTAYNDATINNQIVDPVGNSIQTIFLGGGSNISVGVNADSTGFNIDTNPWLRIAGNVFSFETKGDPTRSVYTGKNAIFVDLNGRFSIEPGFIANMGVMVIKSHNGIVDLPANQVFFSHGAGIATWNVDLSDPDDQIIIGPGQCLSTYIFNWILAQKDCPNFTPFNCCIDACMCPPVTEANVTSLPTIEGCVDDLQIQGTRIGVPAQFLIDGGEVRRLTFDGNACGAGAPVAVIVLRNNGTIGLDSTTTLGANGITIIADGSGRVNVNSDLVIDNVCAFVKGPNFESCDILSLYSSVPREIRLKSTGTLNLTSFDDQSQIIALMGQLRLVVEPGAQIITGAGTLRFAEDSILMFEASNHALDFFSAIPFGAENFALPITTVDAALPHNPLSSLTNFGLGLHNTDQFRVVIAGSGTIELVDNGQAILPFNAFVGIETIDTPTCSIPETNITFNITDNGDFAIGRLNYNEGGVLQIGNIDFVEDHSVNFTLTLNGENANFGIGSRGFVGFGVGIERFDGQVLPAVGTRVCPESFTPNQNIINTLSNVNDITFNLFNGRFQHDRIFPGDDVNASLIAASGASGVAFNLNFELSDENISPTLERTSDFNIAGGGNFVLVNPATGGIQPIVFEQDGLITPRLSVTVLASTLLQAANTDIAGLTGAQLFDYLKTHDAILESSRDNTLGRANAASQGDSFRPESDNIRIDTVSEGVILRGPAYDIIGEGQEDSKRRNAIDAAAVFVNIDVALNEILTATNIQS